VGRNSDSLASGGYRPRFVFTHLAVLLALAVCVMLAAGCSFSPRGPTSASRTSVTRAGSATTIPKTAPPTTAPPFYVVTTQNEAGLGEILVNGQGFTLYMFEPDARSGNSTCYGECENLWPPLLLVDGVKAPMAGAGVDASLLGTSARRNEPEQITYNGWPLYRWSGDTQPGELTGQGLNNAGGLWYVLSPQGAPITTRP
jgi:predicted lipoprotein with Yx(FWY)xxD motif